MHIYTSCQRWESVRLRVSGSGCVVVRLAAGGAVRQPSVKAGSSHPGTGGTIRTEMAHSNGPVTYNVQAGSTMLVFSVVSLF